MSDKSIAGILTLNEIQEIIDALDTDLADKYRRNIKMYLGSIRDHAVRSGADYVTVYAT